MDPQKRKIIIAVVLIVGIGLLFYVQFRRATTPPGGAAPTPAGQTAQPVTGEEGKTTAAHEEPVQIDTKAILASLEAGKFVYDYTTLRDPMTPVIYGRGAAGGEGPGGAIAVSRAHVLDGIVWSTDNPLASIDSVVVGIGERLADGAVVQKIFPDKVILSTDTGTFSVGFYEE